MNLNCFNIWMKQVMQILNRLTNNSLPGWVSTENHLFERFPVLGTEQSVEQRIECAWQVIKKSWIAKKSLISYLIWPQNLYLKSTSRIGWQFWSSPSSWSRHIPVSGSGKDSRQWRREWQHSLELKWIFKTVSHLNNSHLTFWWSVSCCQEEVWLKWICQSYCFLCTQIFSPHSCWLSWWWGSSGCRRRSARWWGSRRTPGRTSRGLGTTAEQTRFHFIWSTQL